MIGHAQLSLLIIGGGPTGCLIIFLILLKIGQKVSTCIRVTPVKSFLNQITHSIVMIKSPNALYMSIIR